MKSTVAGPERHTVSSNEKRDFSPYIGWLAHKQEGVSSLTLYFFPSSCIFFLSDDAVELSRCFFSPDLLVLSKCL